MSSGALSAADAGRSSPGISMICFRSKRPTRSSRRRGLRTPFIRVAKDGAIVETRRASPAPVASARPSAIRSSTSGSWICSQPGTRSSCRRCTGSGLRSSRSRERWAPSSDTPSRSTRTSPRNSHRGSRLTTTSTMCSFSRSRARSAGSSTTPFTRIRFDDQPWTQHRSAVESRAAEVPRDESVLESGDVLYLPRGFIHSAEA